MNLLHEAKTREKSADTVKKPGGKAISSRQQTVPGRETPLFTLSLLSISLITIMGSAVVSPVLGEIGRSFPASSAVEIQMILTIISLTSFVMSFVTGLLCRRGRKKRVLLIGLALFTLGGTGCAAAPSLAVLLFLRGLFGVGLGIVTPLASSLVVDFYDAGRRTRFIGFSQTAAQLGSMLSTMASGLLAAVNWRYAFLLYGVGAVIFVLAALVLKEPVSEKTVQKPPLSEKSALKQAGLKKPALRQRPQPGQGQPCRGFTTHCHGLAEERPPAITSGEEMALSQPAAGGKPLAPRARHLEHPPRIPRRIWLLFAVNLLFGIIFSSCFANLSMRATGLGIEPSRAGIAISMAAGGAIFGSMLYERLARRFGRASMALLWAVIGVMYLGLMLAGTVWTMGICMLFLGLFGGMLTVSLLSMAGEGANPHVSTQYMGIVQAGALLGTFLCPFVFAGMGRLLGNADIGFGFGINGVQALLMALISLSLFQRGRADSAAANE